MSPEPPDGGGEPDLDAIAAELADVELALERMIDGTDPAGGVDGAVTP